MKIYNIYAYHEGIDDCLERETYYIGTDRTAGLVIIRTMRLVSATIETWEDGKLIGEREYWRLNDNYSVIDDPNF